MLQSIAFLALAAIASASYSDNLNFRSPSHHHPALGLSLRKIAARHDASDVWDPSKLNFTHGVASGDPYDTTVILWTRIAPSSDNDKSNITVSGYVPIYDHSTTRYNEGSKAPVCVQYSVASDKAMKNVVDHGTVYTSSDIDYTVKVSLILKLGV
jgi:alkaline phosphatase D